MRSHSYRKVTGIRIIAFIGTLVLISAVIVFSGTLFRIASFALNAVTLPRAQELELLPKHILASRAFDSERQLTQIRYQAVLYEAALEENTRLKELLELEVAEEHYFGRVLARPPKTHYDTLLVRVAEANRVQENDRVFFNDLFIGEVERIEGVNVVVTLLSNPDATHDAQVGDPTSIVSLRGLGGGSFVFSIPNDVGVVPGDVVVSATNSLHVIGVVDVVETKEDSTNKTVYMHTGAPFSDIDFVSFRKQ